MKGRSNDRGFTLLELMVVVAIVAVLAVVAVASYSRFQRNARRGDGLALMNDIRMKQETFFNTYSRYLSSTTDESEFTGTAEGDTGMYYWPDACENDPDSAWCRLGFRPQGVIDPDSNKMLLYFQLQTIAWEPGADAPGMITDDTERWWSVQARGLPDGSYCTLMRLTNEVREAMVFDTWDTCE